MARPIKITPGMSPREAFRVAEKLGLDTTGTGRSMSRGSEIRIYDPVTGESTNTTSTNKDAGKKICKILRRAAERKGVKYVG